MPKVPTKIFSGEAPKGKDVRDYMKSVSTTASNPYDTGKNNLVRDQNSTKSAGELGGLKGFPQ